MSKIVSQAAPREHIQCAHDLCKDPAIMVRYIHGWVKLCAHHDRFHVQQEANEFCRQNMIDTRTKQMAFIKEKLRTKSTPYEHWLRVQQTQGLLPIAYEWASSYLARLNIQREPGQEG